MKTCVVNKKDEVQEKVEPGDTFIMKDKGHGTVYVRIRTDKGLHIWPDTNTDDFIFGVSLVSGNVFVVKRTNITPVKPCSVSDNTVIFKKII